MIQRFLQVYYPYYKTIVVRSWQVYESVAKLILDVFDLA